jgi:aspartate carbamoyltransferase catalytic subunit
VQPEEILANLKCKYHVYDNLDAVIGKTDVLYVTRIQKERFADLV